MCEEMILCIDKYLGGRSITRRVSVMTPAMLARGQDEIRRVPQPNIKRAFYRRTLSNTFPPIIGKLAAWVLAAVQQLNAQIHTAPVVNGY